MNVVVSVHTTASACMVLRAVYYVYSMAESLGPSFIPKQNPTKVARRTATRQVYLFTIISYVILFSTLIAVAALFIYGRLTTSTLAKAVSAYNTEIASFNQDTMHEVIELDERLARTGELLDANISLRAALAVIEAATIDTVQFSEVAFERGDGNQVKLDATVTTDSFDSVLFQREMYEEAERLTGVSIEDVKIEFIQADAENGIPQSTTVGFSALFDLAPSTIAYQPVATTTESYAESSSMLSPGGATPTSTDTSSGVVATSTAP